MGGHKMYPKKTDSDIRMFKEGIEIGFGRIRMVIQERLSIK